MAEALPVAPADEAPEVNDAIMGLVALGFDQSEARRLVVRGVMSESPETPAATEIIRSVLRNQGGQ